MFFKKITLCAMIGAYFWCQANENNQPNTPFTYDDMQEVITIIKKDPALNKKFESIINSEKGLHEIIKCINNNDKNDDFHPSYDESACSHPILATHYTLHFPSDNARLNHWRGLYTDAQNKKVDNMMHDKTCWLWMERYYEKLDNQTIPLYHYSSLYFVMKKLGTHLLCQANENERYSVFTFDDMQNVIKIIQQDQSLVKEFGSITNSENGLNAIVQCVNNKKTCWHPALTETYTWGSLNYKQLLNHWSGFYTAAQNKKVDDVIKSDIDYASGLTLEHHYKVRDTQTIPLFNYACLYKAMKKQNRLKNEE